MDQRTLAVFGLDGLGNRILTLELACRMARKAGMKLYVDWNDSVVSLDAFAFDDFFELVGVERCRVLNASDIGSRYPMQLEAWDSSTLQEITYGVSDPEGVERFLKPWRYLSKWKRHYRFVAGGYAFRNGEFLGPELLKHQLVLMRCSLPSREPEKFRHLKLSSVFLKRFTDFGVRMNLSIAPDIGVHVRHTDKRSDDFNRAFDVLDSVLNNSITLPVIHIATDSSEVLAEAELRYRRRARIQALRIVRDESPIHLRLPSHTDKREDAFFALADLKILANAGKLIFMESSSFSRVAVAWSGDGSEVYSW